MAAKAKPKKNGSKLGPDGTVVQNRRIRTRTQAIATLKVRCRPGTFEWRYGSKGSPEYHAGAAFARLWEQAGIANAGSSAIGAGGVGDWKGMPDGRVAALDEVRNISIAVGGPSMRRLVAYCVEGRTPVEIAASYDVSARAMSETLDINLIDLARIMGYATDRTVDLSAKRL